MDITGKVVSLKNDYVTGNVLVTLLLNTKDMQSVENLSKLEKLAITIKKFFKKRSLDANAYCWVLCDKIAKELSKDSVIVTKEQIYKDSILQIGRFEPMIIQEKAYEKFKRIWGKQGLGFLIQEVSRKNKCVKVNCYYGSSSYDTQEMYLLIQNIEEFAKSLNIETKSKEEVESLLKEWE